MFSLVCQYQTAWNYGVWSHDWLYQMFLQSQNIPLFYLRPLFFEYLFYKHADHIWNPPPGNKSDFFLLLFLHWPAWTREAD